MRKKYILPTLSILIILEFYSTVVVIYNFLINAQLCPLQNIYRIYKIKDHLQNFVDIKSKKKNCNIYLYGENKPTSCEYGFLTLYLSKNIANVVYLLFVTLVRDILYSILDISYTYEGKSYKA